MKLVFKIISILLLASCQTLGLVQEDPNGPVKLDLNYESFMSESWNKKAETSLINLDFFSENIESELFFDLNGTTVFVIKDQQLDLIDYETGEVNRSFNLETDRIISGISVGYNTFLYADADGVIYAHDSNSGDLKWTIALEDVVLSEMLVTSTEVFVQTSSDVLYGLDLQNGEIQWSKKAQAPLLSIRGTATPVIFEGLIFTSFSNGRLAAVRAIDGIQLWEKPISRLKGSTELEKLMDADSVAIPINEDVFAANYNGSLTRFNIRGGDKVFSVDHSTLKPIILHRNTIVSINTDEEILGFNATNGTEIWRSQKFKNRDITDLVLYDDKVYFGDLEGYIHEIDPETGMISGLTETNLKSIRQIVIYSDKLVAQDIEGSVSAFDLN
jgi:outer membrane protein assembly factor BamB|tara:strand:+ start:945 stop:2102 length:1158 start_codon:yes stop_codon:yes gene_type:complete